MTYAEYLKTKIKESGWSYSEIGRRCEREGVKIDKAYLSRICNDVLPPASEKVNTSLVSVLEKVTNIEYQTLRILAYRRKIPKDVLESIISEELESINI
jgi:hypothetical protein